MTTDDPTGLDDHYFESCWQPDIKGSKTFGIGFKGAAKLCHNAYLEFIAGNKMFGQFTVGGALRFIFSR